MLTRTFLVWDLEGSTKAWESRPGDARLAVSTWADAAGRAVGEHGGRLFKLVGDGGWAEFESAAAGLRAAVDLQRAMAGAALGARTALYSGEAERAPDGDWLGVPLNRCARLVNLGHPGQVLVAGSTALLLGDVAGELRELGLYRLRDVADPIVVYQAVADGLCDGFPPLRSDVREVHLPVAHDRLVGRDIDVAHVCDLVDRHRLVTLVGVGGVGKTRLAVEAARLVSTRFEVTTFVDLASVTEPSQVGASVLAALGAVTRAEPSLDMATATVGQRSALLVVDNAEHLLDAVGDLCERLFSDCANARMLVTSREPLGIDGENVWRVPSLDPDGGAVELFLERLGSDAPDEVAIKLCRRLDGIPLAIELAAGRARTLGAEEVLANLADRFRILVGGRRATGRQATLHAALDWSHQLLDTPQRVVLRRLAVFADGFSVHAATTVCGAVGGPDVRDVLAALVDKSLVVFGERDRRHRLLETVRAYAYEQLVQAGEVEAVRDAHVAWVAAELAARPFNDATTLYPLLPEAANIRAAMDWLMACGRDRELIALFVSSAGIWYLLLEPELEAKMASAFARCAASLTRCEQAEALTIMSAVAGDKGPWVQRVFSLDPHGDCESTVNPLLYRGLLRSFDDPLAALADVEAVRRRRRPLPPDTDLLLRQVESQARFRSGDRRGAEDVLVALLDGHRSIFSFAPILSLASLRIALGDIDGAQAVYDRVTADPHHDLRVGMVAFPAVRCELLAARGEHAQAAAVLRSIETIRDQRLAAYPAADHLWLEAAAYLASRADRLGDASTLSWAANQTPGPGPFITWSLEEQFANNDAWLAARATPPTIERARQTARLIARHL